MNLLQMSNDIEAMSECSRAVGTAEVANTRAFVPHMADQRMFYLIPGRSGKKIN